MKKTIIALLLVLAIVSVNVFAEGPVDASTLGNTTSIKVTAGVTGVALFGVSEAALVPADFLSETAFKGKTLSTITKNFTDLTSLKTAQSVGYLSGFNTTNSAVKISVSVSDLVNTDSEDANDIALTVTPSTSENPLIITAANETAGSLASTEITVVATTPAQIDVAPAGKYTATVTFTVSGS